ncbi:DUF992 domain-containing protein [Starkeya sp. 3C]|uniref:DUF992 domain-containing protein n=1 Tax=Ancylobacter moscoviensis TaxID=2597768 RepID=A0ABY3DQH4_9HYPH|nr:DUF992 domain-containing protein [Ancylobacter moscoviensis]TSJ62041.1 DUF992 domain-containing protein [Ancylobacter moscoviensis]
MKKAMLALAAAGVLASAFSAHAADRVDAGVLVCSVGSSISMIVESKQELSCTYKPTQGPDVTYTGVIQRVGVDLGVTGAGMLTWGVAAVTKAVAPGALAGKYAGVSGDVALGIGVGANALVSTDNSIALNPVSVEGNIGASLALGVAELTLTYKP